MKKCQLCGQPAHVFLTQLVDGEATELQLCARCAKENGLFAPQALTSDQHFSLEHLKQVVESLVREISQATTRIPMNSNNPDFPIDHVFDSSLRCPHCKLSFEQQLQSGHVGCVHCYTAFRHKMNFLPAEEQTTLTLIDNEPSIDISRHDQQQLRLRLEAEMQQAAAREDYEEAARLRDQLKELTTES